MAEAVRHPIFARVYEQLSKLMEREIGEERDELLAGLSGRVVEIGAGNGMNFAHYPPTVEEVVAVEPEPYLRERAVEAARSAPVTVMVRDGLADSLPVEDGEFDAAVVCLVLCTVPDPAGALEEIRRTLKPGAELRVLEHVRSRSQRRARVQAWLDRSGVWPRVAGGCHCSRDTAAAVRSAGFEFDQLRDFDFGPACGPTRPHVIGVARAPASAS